MSIFKMIKEYIYGPVHDEEYIDPSSTHRYYFACMANAKVLKKQEEIAEVYIPNIPTRVDETTTIDRDQCLIYFPKSNKLIMFTNFNESGDYGIFRVISEDNRDKNKELKNKPFGVIFK